jgi:hypothetical protein
LSGISVPRVDSRSSVAIGNVRAGAEPAAVEVRVSSIGPHAGETGFQ